MSPFYQYVEDVLGDRIVVGRFIRLAVERFIKDRDKKDFVFDEKEGQRIIDFSEKFCNHWKGPKRGKPILLEPHQNFYWMQKYGWKNPDTNLPRFRRSVKMIARKQYKTTEAAIESLFHMKKGVDQPAQVFTCATKEDDAVIVVNDAGRIAMGSPKIKSAFRCMIHEPYVRRVICDNDSFMTYMTKGHDAVDISFGVGDECHDWPDASIKNRIESAMGNRVAPMFSTITTAGFEKAGYCFTTLRDTCIKILSGTLTDEEQLILIFELDEGDDWKDPDKWVKSNPNVPYSLTHKKYLESEFKKALNEGGTTEMNFKTKNLNMWVDAPATWVQGEIFAKNTHGISVQYLEGRECFGAWHNITAKDLNAFCLFFPNVKEDVHAVKMLFFIPSETLKNNELERYPEALHICPGNVLDNDFVIEKITEEISKYTLDSVVFRSGQENNEIVQALTRDGIICNPINQGFRSMSEPTAAWEKLLLGHQIEHFGNPVLSWCNSNTMAIRSGDDIKIERSGTRTCGIAACINALAQWKTIEAGGKMTNFQFESL